jgi:hypothetical protein
MITAVAILPSERPSMKSLLRALLATVAALVLLPAVSASAATIKLDAPWTGSGTGTTTVVSNGATADPRFDYNVNAYTGSWTFHAAAATTRSVPVEYDSSGFYSWYQVSVKLERFISRGGVDVLTETLVQQGPTDCCSAPSGGFDYTGRTTFNVQAGDVYGFRISGSNFTGGPVMSGSLKLYPVDYDAPVVTPAETGTKGDGDFYTGPASVKWTVTDPDSPIVKSGCEDATVSADTAGKTFTCTATSRGGTTKRSVTIKRDATAPELTVPAAIVKQADGADGATVTYAPSATDGIDAAPVVTCSPASDTRFPLGTTTVTCTAKDAAGNATTKTFDAIVFPAAAAPQPSVNPSPSPAKSGPKSINAVLSFRFTIAKQTTRLVQLKVKKLPKGATVIVTCTGSSCPKKLKGKGQTLTSKGTTLSLSTLVNTGLKSGTTINVAISSPDAITTIKTLEVRKGKAPVVADTCRQPGSQKPVAC